MDLSLVGVDTATMRAYHDAAGVHLDEDLFTARPVPRWCS